MPTTSLVLHQLVSTSGTAYRSASFQGAVHKLSLFARDDTAPILLEGESGTGKTSIARYVHRLSPRARGPFQHVILSTIDDGIAASELFGHIAGAFTDARQSRTGHFASASGGTLFLDEIGKASLSIQSKLLHALEYGEIRPVGSDRQVRVNARIIAATNVDLGVLVARGTFLPDLYARLETFRTVLPPLRKRRADISFLVCESVQRHYISTGYSRAPVMDAALMTALSRAPWPNNIRQLDGTVHRLLLQAEGASPITLGHCTDDLAWIASHNTPRHALTRDQAMAAITRAGSVSAAARALGMDRKTLRNIRDGAA